jgi:hypothetical protein
MTTTDAARSTPPDADAQRRRIEELARRRAAGARKPTVARGADRRSRAHPARNARIGAVGAGLTTMLGLIAAMGSSAASGGAATVAPVSGPRPAVVTIEKSAPAASPGATASTSASPVQTSTSPIALTARPTVRQVAPTTAVASTHGSR